MLRSAVKLFAFQEVFLQTRLDVGKIARLKFLIIPMKSSTCSPKSTIPILWRKTIIHLAGIFALKRENNIIPDKISFMCSLREGDLLLDPLLELTVPPTVHGPKKGRREGTARNNKTSRWLGRGRFKISFRVFRVVFCRKRKRTMLWAVEDTFFCDGSTGGSSGFCQQEYPKIYPCADHHCHHRHS